MARCDCFEHTPVQLLSETCSMRAQSTEKGLIIVFTCPHGRIRRHLACPGAADWDWAARRFGEALRGAALTVAGAPF